MQFRFHDGRDWFFQERFGMFVHWGIYAARAWHEQYQWRMHVPKAEYEKLVSQFHAASFDPESWLDLCQEAGMSYLCFTTKHHDGFCMWDTKYTDYKITNAPCGKDLLALLASACHRRGIRLGLYYSCPDWHHPSSINFGGDHQLAEPNPGDQPDLLAYIQYVKNQITELCTNYGEISEFFWDIPQGMNFPELNATIRTLQPNCLINDRGYGPGDYGTPERSVPIGASFSKPTEACDSVGRTSWGFRKNEDYYTPLAIEQRMDRIFAMGGNFLLNVGPREDGTIPEEAAYVVREAGKWYRTVKEAFQAEPFAYSQNQREYILTKADNGTLYAHFPHGVAATGFEIAEIDTLPKQITLLNDGRELPFSIEYMPSHAYEGRQNLHIWGLPAEKLQNTVPVVKIQL